LKELEMSYLILSATAGGLFWKYSKQMDLTIASMTPLSRAGTWK
jgi:hypothetical protein